MNTSQCDKQVSATKDIFLHASKDGDRTDILVYMIFHLKFCTLLRKLLHFIPQSTSRMWCSTPTWKKGGGG